MKISDRCLVDPGKKFRLKDRDPDDTLGFKEKRASLGLLQKNVARMGELQQMMCAAKKHAILIVLQAIDAGGKDGTIRHVMTGLNPQGCRVTSFKQPSAEEQAHDFLWRVHNAVPKFGDVGIFNRSHYEEVLVVRVHSLVPKEIWQTRFDQINRFESLLVENNVVILKFFLHISKDEQKKRIEARLQDPSKNWKFSPADLQERALWDDYHEAFEDALRKCSKEGAPWYVIPANHKWVRNLAISNIIVETMEKLDMKFPAPQFDPKSFEVK